MNIILLYILYCVKDWIDLEQQILVGPIIGKVTDSTARILIELSIPEVITMHLKSELSQHITLSSTLSVNSRQPTVFKFENLIPHTKYFISISHKLKTKSGKQSSFKTLDSRNKSFSQLNTAIVSCNDIRHASVDTNKSLWADLSQRVERGEIDYLLHLGDQVYLDHEEWDGSKDNAYTKVLDYFKRNNVTDYYQYKEYAREIIREDYRMTFGYKPTAEVMSRVPSLMIMDDHEIHNNLILDESFNDHRSFNNFWKNQARYVFYQYQRQLREDVDFENYLSLGHEYFEENINGVKFIFLDFRGIKAWDNQFISEEFYLGQQQHEWLDKILLIGNPDFNTVVIVSSIPVATFSREVTKYLASEIKDFEEYWSFNHEQDQISFFNTLYDWKKSDEHREVFLIGGDTHFGFTTDIYFNQQPFIKQLTTSPISQVPYSPEYVYAINNLLKIQYSLDKDFCFNHYNYITDNNYGILKMRTSSDEKAFIEYFLVASSSRHKETMSDYNFSFRDLNLINCCGDDCRIRLSRVS